MEKQTLIIVSGLQRSGTSMMMQILQSVGIVANINNVRKPDKFNPNGYFEHSEMANLLLDDSFLDEGIGKCTKVYAAWLKFLPKRYNYKIIFMERDLNEILISRRKINNNNVKAYSSPHINRMERIVEQSNQFISNSNNIEMLSVNYNSMLVNPKKSLKAISKFLSIDESKMLNTEKVVNINLYTSNNKQDYLTIDRSPSTIVEFIEQHVKDKIYCEIGIGEGDHLAQINNAKKVFGIEKAKYGVIRCKEKHPELEIIHASIFDILEKIVFEVCYFWMIYPLNRELVLAILKKNPNAKILMGINYYFHLDKNEKKYHDYVNSYREIASADNWNQNTKDLIKEVKSLGFNCETVEIEAKNKEIFSVAIIEK